jgi:PKD repeat protein
MKYLSFSFVAIVAMLTLCIGCTPTPQACFTTNKTTVDVNEAVSLKSCGEDANRILWNFGDGYTFEGDSATHAYAIPGTYLVEMKALSKKDKKWDRSTVIINVVKKQRYLSRIKINSINQLNPQGSSWDLFPDVGPDLYFELGVDSSQNSLTINPPANNIQTSQFPILWDLNSTGLIPLSNQNWKLNLFDNDGTLLQPNSELMTSFVFNPYSISLSSSNVIQLQQSNYQIELQIVEF